jgi:predicted nucleic acid-binding protein
VIHLDTSLLVDALAISGPSEDALASVIDQRLAMRISSIVLYEWLRGPRSEREINIQETLFPETAVVPFHIAEARAAAKIYRSIKRPRTREADVTIAATAIHHKARLWTLNPADFADIPGLQLYRPR